MTLNAIKREIQGKQVKQLRAGEQLPASVYGASRNPSISVTLDGKLVRNAFKEYGYSKIFDLDIEGEAKPSKVVFKEIQSNTLTGKIIHVSFHQIEMDKPITAEIPLHIVGLSMAVKNNLGMLITPLSKVNVHCLPGNLPEGIEIDISVLNNVGDVIQLDKVKLPEGVEVGHGTPKDAVIAYIAAPQKIEEETPVAATEAAAIPAEGDAAKTEGEAAKPAAKTGKK